MIRLEIVVNALVHPSCSFPFLQDVQADPSRLKAECLRILKKCRSETILSPHPSDEFQSSFLPSYRFAALRSMRRFLDSQLRVPQSIRIFLEALASTSCDGLRRCLRQFA